MGGVYYSNHLNLLTHLNFSHKEKNYMQGWNWIDSTLVTISTFNSYLDHLFIFSKNIKSILSFFIYYWLVEMRHTLGTCHQGVERQDQTNLVDANSSFYRTNQCDYSLAEDSIDNWTSIWFYWYGQIRS